METKQETMRQKGVITIFKPDNGNDYYEKNRKEDLKRGGKA